MVEKPTHPRFGRICLTPLVKIACLFRAATKIHISARGMTGTYVSKETGNGLAGNVCCKDCDYFLSFSKLAVTFVSIYVYGMKNVIVLTGLKSRQENSGHCMIHISPETHFNLISFRYLEKLPHRKHNPPQI